MALNEPKLTNNFSTSSNSQNKRERLEISTESENEAVNRHIPNIRRSIRSRLTVFQIILLILNVIGIISFIIIVMTVKKRSIPCEGFFYFELKFKIKIYFYRNYIGNGGRSSRRKRGWYVF
jgi:hypothetical protein